MPVPYFTISADGVDVTGRLAGLGMTMTVTDGAGLKSDTLQITIDDPEGSVEPPRTGAVLNPLGGYEGRMRDFGLFSVDSVVYSGWPQKITIDAKSVAAKSLAKQREPKAYPKEKYPTYGDIFSEIAGKIGLTLQISVEIGSKENPYEAQAEEDSLEFTTRLGEKLNASVSVKSGNLVVAKKGSGESVGGVAMGVIFVAKGYNILSYTVTEKDEPKHSEVEATYYDRQKNKRETVTESTGLDGPKFLVRTPFQNKEEAEEAAKSRASELVRMTGDASFEIDGEPFAQAEAYAVVSGCRSRVNGLWWVQTATHQFSADGPYTTSLQCGAPTDEGKGNASEAASAGGGPPGSGYEAGTPQLTSPDTGVA
ncbi:hypothetical protein PMI07_000894 [Rhizobium sp. CF080]|uniref:phage late control D family protein n=1 Tax=Rhizobium sp. (strain CF080) TaxID=1144310 RepID=UPI000271B4B3|nr:hypothetical protein [Rhizobium sp. CF080]EUB97318.1 hypothetical protein PMI07_000894 [Rhizobium sp. CF080]